MEHRDFAMAPHLDGEPWPIFESPAGTCCLLLLPHTCKLFKPFKPFELFVGPFIRRFSAGRVSLFGEPS